MTKSETIHTLKKASLYLETKTIIDRQFPDLGNTIKNAEGYKIVNDKSVQSMLIKTQIAMPFTCLSQASLLKPSSPSGIAPLLNKAYFAIRNRLYIWDYYENKDVMVHEEDSEITAVEFVQPKRDVFRDSVSQLLVITTTSRIKILAVSSDNFTLFETNMSTNANSGVIRKIYGTAQGRIFMLGDDLNLWELDYRTEEGWFTGRCYKKLHSSSSLSFISSYFNHAIIGISSNSTGNILYQLTQQSAIIVTWLKDGSFQHIISKDIIGKHATSLQGDKIVSIHATSPNESRKYQLVAITNAGHRLYFTIYNKEDLNQDIPDTLELLYTRPPPQLLNGTLSKSIYHDAIYLTVKTDANGIDEIVETNPDIGHLSQVSPPRLVEFATTLPVSGKVLRVESLPVLGYDKYQINEIAVPSTTSARQFLVLTTTGLMVLVKQRPIDMFESLIINSANNTPTLSEELLSFIRHFGGTNTSALSFGLISNVSLTVNDVNRLYSPAAIKGAKAVLSRLKLQSENRFINQDGLALFIYRTIQPIWENPLFTVDNSSVNPLSQLRNTLEILRSLSKSILENVNMTTEVEEMQLLVNYLCQAITFFLYLFESDINVVLSGLQPDALARLRTITLKELVTSIEGKGFIDELTNLLINHEFKKNSNLAFVLDTLQQHCGDFCGVSDVVVAKVAKEIRNTKSKESMNRALVIVSKIANYIPQVQLHDITNAFVQQGFPEYAVEITLAVINTHPTPIYYQLYADLLLAQSEDIVKRGFYTRNKDLHFTVYEKFIECGRGLDLIKASPIYLEEYLKSKGTIENMQLLGSYYKLNECYEDAARTLMYLARMPGGLNTNRRIDLLNEAYQCTQSVTAPPKQYEMYQLGKEIKDLLVLAQNNE